ncbi:MAG: hypothetical protein FJ318_00460 [SAR202 cluster bacterium]|nr:hypothetical protein [SAR202 cluster bacterium]
MPWIIAALVLTVIAVVAWTRILRRIGWDPLLAGLAILPLTHVLLLALVAFSRWPLDRRVDSIMADLKRLRGER